MKNESEGIGKRRIEEEWQVADTLLRRRSFTPILAARLLLEILEETDDMRQHGENELSTVRRIIHLGCENYRLEQDTVSFQELVENTLFHKSHRRERTLQELMQFCRRMLRQDPAWEMRRVRDITAEDCRKLICNTFATTVMRRKARIILHGLFAYAQRHGWCDNNPTDGVEIPPPKEKRICALSIREIRCLLVTCLQKEHMTCAPAVGLLLWAGIRPYELERLHWENIRFGDKVICIPSTHSKTGGARQVTLHPVLYNWLLQTSSFRLPQASIIPASWAKRWRMLRKAAGFTRWDADLLRHTYASYHLKYFRNLHELQIDMGHSTADLLRTRYLGMENVTAEGAAEFWHFSVERLRTLTARGRKKSSRREYP